MQEGSWKLKQVKMLLRVKTFYLPQKQTEIKNHKMIFFSKITGSPDRNPCPPLAEKQYQKF
jgi:hypothetical protein